MKPIVGFGEYLFDYIDKNDMTDVEVYKKAQIDRRLFSKIRSGNDYQPKKSNIFRLIIGCEMDEKHAEELLKLAGFCFSSNDKRDVIVKYFIINSIFDVDRINLVLDYFGVKNI